MNRLWHVALFFVFSLILPNILFAQLDESATATLFIRVSEANSDTHRQQLREAIENEKKQILKTQLQIDDLQTKEKDLTLLLIDGQNLDETVSQQMRIQLAQLQEELASQMAQRKRVELAISRGGNAADGMVWELQHLGDSQLAKQLIELRVKKNDLEQQYGKDHPHVRSLASQIKTLERKSPESKQDETKLEKRMGGDSQLAKKLIELRLKKKSLEQQFGKGHPNVRSLASQIETLERKSPESKQDETKLEKRMGGDSQHAKPVVPISQKQLELIELQLAELRLQKNELEQKLGKDHPVTNKLNARIGVLERETAEAKQDGGPEPKQSSKELLYDFLKRTDASIEKNKASIEDLKQKVELLHKATTSVAEVNQEIEHLAEQLRESAAKLELVERKLKNINDSSSELSFLFFKSLFSETHLRRFALKHRKTIGVKEKSVPKLIENVKFKPDELGQEYVYRLSVRNDSPVVEKAILYLLVQEIEAVAIENENNPVRKRLDGIESEHDEVVKLLAAVDTKLQTASDEAEKLQLQQKKERYSQRLQILKDSITKWQKKASRAPDVELDVMSRGWEIKGDQEQSEYDKLRKQHADFPDLSNSAD